MKNGVNGTECTFLSDGDAAAGRGVISRSSFGRLPGVCSFLIELRWVNLRATRLVIVKGMFRECMQQPASYSLSLTSTREVRLGHAMEQYSWLYFF